MKTTFQITRNELRNLFYSPIAWFLLIIFLVMCAYFYTGVTYFWAKALQLPYANDPHWVTRTTDSITLPIYLARDGILTNVLQSIYLFVPLLTMGIISREVSSGTIKLLLSSPVKLRQIVLGKYLAMMIYNLLLVMIVGIFVVNGFFDIKDLDYGILLSSLLAFYLLLCALTAIGIYMSSLTTYPIVSAVASFTIFFVLMNIGRIWQEYDFVRDLTWFLSIAGRTEKMVTGLIVTRDILYYFVIIGMFLSFTLLKLRAGRENRPWYVKTGRYLAVVAAGLLIGYVGSLHRFTRYWDTTARKVNSLTPQSQQIIRSLNEGPLEVTLYTNLLGGGARAGMPDKRNYYLANCWDIYQRFKWDINFKYEYYYDVDSAGMSGTIFREFPGKTLPQIAAEMAKVMQVNVADFMPPAEMRKRIDLKGEDYRLVMRLKYKDRSVFLRTYGGGDWPAPMNIDAALLRLLGTPMPKVAFVTGSLERNIHKGGEREFSFHTTVKENAGALVNIGFDVDTINLATQNIGADVTTLVLADPKVALSDTVMQKLRDYLHNGGSMFVMGAAHKQHVLNPLLQQTGFQLIPGKLVQPSQNEAPNVIVPYLTMAGLENAKEEPGRRFKHLWSHGVRDDSLLAWMPNAAGLAQVADSGFTATTIFETVPGKVWSKMGKVVTDSVAPVFSPQEGDIRQHTFPVCLQLSRRTGNKEQRIVLAGNGDFLSNQRSPAWLFREFFSWLNERRMPVYSVYPYATDNKVLLTPLRASIQKIAYMWVLPGILALLGAVLLIRRKRK